MLPAANAASNLNYHKNNRKSVYTQPAYNLEMENMIKLKFSELNLTKEVMKAIDDLGFEEATPIQSESIPVLMQGKDLIGQAQTGTGKTAAFGIPIIQSIDKSIKEPQALILCPTRELAVQVSEEMSKFAKYKKEIAFLPVYGGQSIDRQLKAIKKGVQVIIGTPGRILDHLERKTIDLSHIKHVVLDEADEMLDMGFRDDIEMILKTTPRKKQTALFSATMPRAIVELAKRYQTDPVHVKVVHEVLTVANTEQIYFEVRDKEKLEALCRIVDLNNLKLALVFCNTKRGVDDLVSHLKGRGYAVEGLHGDMKQVIREKVLNGFKKGVTELLVATDVAARGLDIDNVEAVFNYDMPQDEDYYVHRIGRTGRAGKPGKAFTFVSGGEIYKLRIFQKYIKTKIKQMNVPSYDDVEEMRVNVFFDDLKSVIKKGNFKKETTLLERLLNEDFTSLEIAAALLRMRLNTERKDDNSFDSKGKSGKGKSVEDFRTARLFLTVGKKDKAKPGDILGAIAGESGLPGSVVGDIDMFDKYTFVNVPAAYVEQIIDALQGCKIKNRKIHIEEANAKDRN